MNDLDTVEEHKEKVIVVKLTDEDIQKLSVAIMNEFTKQFQINIGKGIMEYLWKAFLTICVLALGWTSLKGIK